MSNYGYANKYGEPLMDGAAYRYEQYLDSTHEPDPDDFYGLDDDYEVDPDDCSHDDGTFLASGVEGATEGDFRCDACYDVVGRWVMGADGWPARVV